MPSPSPLPFPDPPLTNGTTALRPWSERDLPTLASADGDPEVHRFRHSLPETADDARQWLRDVEAARERGERVELAITGTHDAAAAIGGICVWNLHPRNRTAYVSYWLLQAGRGHGHATRAVTLTARYAFTTLGLERLTARVEPANHASQRVVQRAGFVHEGTLRADAVDRTGRRVDIHLYGLLRSDGGR